MLTAAGLLLALLFVVNVVLKTIFKRETPGFFDMLLASLTTVVLVLALTQSAFQGAADPALSDLLLRIGAALAIIGLVVMIVEAVRKQRIWGSRGMFGIGVGLLITLAAFSVPFTSDALAVPTATPIQVAQLAASAVVSPTTVRATATLPPTQTQQPTLTPTDRPTATPTATRWSFTTSTPLPTATAVTPCLASVDFNLRLRAQPDGDAETLVVIPFGGSLLLTGRDETSIWWYTDYEGQSGWVNGEFITRSSACDTLPVRSS